MVGQKRRPIHDLLLRSEHPNSRQKPDRVYGLQATKNFEQLLSTPVVSTSLYGTCTATRDIVKRPEALDLSLRESILEAVRPTLLHLDLFPVLKIWAVLAQLRGR